MSPTADAKDHIYKVVELVGSSEKSIEDAVQKAITRATKTVRKMRWVRSAADEGTH